MKITDLTTDILPLPTWVEHGSPVFFDLGDPSPMQLESRADGYARRLCRKVNGAVCAPLLELNGGKWVLTQSARDAGYRLPREYSLLARLGFALRVARYGHWSSAWAIVGGK